MANEQFKLKPVDYSKPYDEQPECKRHVVGAYANLARHNMTLTVNTIMQAIGMDIFDEDNIGDAFNSTHREKINALDNIQKVNLQKRLYRHFPFFKRMQLEDEAKKSVQLTTLLEVMSDFTSCMADIRNHYSHYHPYDSDAEKEKKLELKKKMGKRLQFLYENTCKVFKTSEAISQEGNEVLAALKIPEDNIEEIFPGNKEYNSLFNLVKDPKKSKAQKRGIKLDQQTGVITRKTVRYVRNPEYQAYMMDDKNGMSDIAIIFFLCLFLDKKVSFDLMDEVGLTEQIKFGGEYADRQMLYLKEIMCMNRIRMIKSKLDSAISDTALALDMLNEVRKCPQALYDVLGKEARIEFKDSATLQWEAQNDKEAVAAEVSASENDEEETVDNDTPRSTFVRWDDRFPQMALRYIDYQGLFSDIRFQLDLGNYRFAFYQHDENQMVDGEPRLRILQKELHGFGRIQEVDEKKNEKWKGLYNEIYVEEGLTQKKPDEAGQAPYITKQYSQYAIDEKSHSIGLRWEGWGEKDKSKGHYGDLDALKMFIPYIPSKPKTEDKQTNQAEGLLAPQAMLNLYELPALLFHQYLHDKYKSSADNAETIIKNTCNGLVTFFKDVDSGDIAPVDGSDIDERRKTLSALLEGYKLQMSYIPERLIDYLGQKSEDYGEKMKKSALQRLDDRQKRVETASSSYDEKKKIIGTKNNKFGKNRATIKTGQLAAWLVRDIMDWTPNYSRARDRLTGQNYTALQATMALFGQQPDNSRKYLKECFRNAHLIPLDNEQFDESAHHPFLQEALDATKQESLVSFYEKYLEKEKEHIASVKDSIENGTDSVNFNKVPFLHCDRKRWNSPDKSLAAQYLKRPVQLPNGIFAKPVFDLLWTIDNPELHRALQEAQQTQGDEQPLSNNVSYLIKLYFELVEHDSSQPFYCTEPTDGTDSRYLHIYRIFKKLYGEKIPHTNQTTTPAYTIDQIRDLRKQARTDIVEYVDKEVEKWINKKLKDFEYKLRGKFNKKNEKRIKNNKPPLNIDEEIQKAVVKKVGTMRTDNVSKMGKKLRNVYDNERTIRRFKTQDMMLLVMARNILKAKSNDRDFTEGFCLKNVMSDSLLDKPVDFQWKVKIGGVDKIIEQKNMKMKNYGQFYKFASDHQRLESLLSRLPDSIFQRAGIENELSYYDSNRSKVFRQVYIIESEAYRLKPELHDDANASEEWFYYISKKTQKKRPVRNSFTSLLEILAAGQDGILNDSEKVTLKKTRNAFGHNTYDVDFDVVFKDRKDKMKIPEVANGIKANIETQTDELKSRIK